MQNYKFFVIILLLFIFLDRIFINLFFMCKNVYLISFIIILSGTITIAQDQNQNFVLSDIFKTQKFKTDNIGSIQFMNDGEQYAAITHDSLNIYSLKSGKFKRHILTLNNLVTKDKSQALRVSNYSFGPNEKKLLLETESEKIYRRSSRANYYIYSIQSEKFEAISNKGKQRLATFSPHGKNVAYLIKNDLYIKELLSGKEIRITTDGKANAIINGATDWVYEEEFGFTKAFFWSVNGRQLAYYKFNEKQVKEFSITRWGNLYPEEYRYKYPKAGERNSQISIWVYDLDSGETKRMDTGEETDIYLPRVQWTKGLNQLSVQWMNRHQNELKILLFNTLTGKSETIYHETNPYYIQITDNLYFLEDNLHFIFTNEKDGFRHIYRYDMKGNMENKITSGNWDIENISSIDEKKHTIYYIGIKSPLNRELYSVNFDGSNNRALSLKEGFNQVRFSKDNNFYINTWSSANEPPITTLQNTKGKTIRLISDNSELANTISAYQFSPKTFFSFTNSEKIELNGWMIKPPDFDSTEKYPVLMYVYGGPGSQTVLNKWDRRLPWFQYLARQGIIIVSVDNRGTGGRGEAFKKSTYMQLGKYETQDQIEAARYIGNLGYVDKSRIGIWGWSYGGFMATSCLEFGADVYTMAIAVAPVTNWRYYDNIYTERYMRKPIENPEGYDNNSPLKHADKIKGYFLLIHGTGDDNVHLQNSIDLIAALNEANVQYQMQLYPNSNHGIYTGANTQYHLYNRMTDFIISTLKTDNEPIK